MSFNRIQTLIAVTATLLAITGCSSPDSNGKDEGKPLIGITGSYSSKGSSSAGDSYVQSVIKGGGVPVIVPFCPTEQVAAEIVSALDGLLVTGGEDVQPAWYAEEVLNETVKCNPARDTSDINLIRQAVAQGKAILGICRGSQIVNVALGGSLYQDIPSQIPNCLTHKQTEDAALATHTVFLEKESYVSHLLGDAETIGANSLHHQCLKDIAPGLKVVGTTSDGVVEICEGLPELDIITIQFHPEKMVYAGDDFYIPVFRDFVERAGN